MRKRSVLLPALVAGAALLVAAPVVAYAGDDDRGSREANHGSRGGDLDVIGLTKDGTFLVEFESDDPDDTDNVGTIDGLVGDTSLVGIDYRPADGKLYGVGDQGGLYTVSDDNADATKRCQLSVAPSGTSFGVDFNPAADRLRIVSDTGQNLRVVVDPAAAAPTVCATTVDGPLSYPPAAPPTTGVTGAAYTNNDADPNTATTLFDLDSVLDQTAIQSPANSGQLAPTGKLGVDASSSIGFDIYSEIRNGTTVSLQAFASLITADGRARLYEINLLQGRATEVGRFDRGDQVSGIAIKLDR